MLLCRHIMFLCPLWATSPNICFHSRKLFLPGLRIHQWRDSRNRQRHYPLQPRHNAVYTQQHSSPRCGGSLTHHWISKGFEPEPRPFIWNVYFDSPPAFTLKQYFDWTNLMCTFFYISEDYGYGTARQDAQFVCIGCKLFDHPTDLCPFPKLPGWFGPSAPDNMDNSNTTLDNRTMSSHSKGASNSSHSHGGRGSSRGHTRGHTKRGRGKTN